MFTGVTNESGWAFSLTDGVRCTTYFLDFPGETPEKKQFFYVVPFDNWLVEYSDV